MPSIAENLSLVQNRIQDAARHAGRDPDGVRLVAVTKTVPVEILREAGLPGGCVLGENKVQEARDKIQQLASENFRWHFIGHLQTNKAKFIPGKFERVHSVDRFELAEEIHRQSLKAKTVTHVLIQVNVSGEASKFGIAPHRLEELLVKVSRLEGLSVHGLMTIPPFDPEPETSRKHFSGLRELRDRMAEKAIDNISLSELSMGMSNDFEVAVEEGATWVRVGTAIFGSRA